MEYQRIASATHDEEGFRMAWAANSRQKKSRRIAAWVAYFFVLLISLVLFNVLFDLKWFALIVTHTVPATAEYLPPLFHHDYGSRRVKQIMGPFRAPGTARGMNMIDHLTLLPPPCNDCVITWMQAGLEYADGTVADSDTGMWLHHAVLSNVDEMSITCPNEVEKIFASGNERVPLDLCDSGRVKTGYYFSSPMHLGVGLELMNENAADAEVYFTMIFEYVPKPARSSFTRSEVVWLDVAGCTGKHEVTAKSGPFFQYQSEPWTSVKDAGRIVLAAGHLHDAGSNITLVQNGETVCNMVTHYGMATDKASLHVRDGSHQHQHHQQQQHITNMTGCANGRDLAIGDTLFITATYDTTNHPLLREIDGNVQELMGITLLYVDTGVVPGAT